MTLHPLTDFIDRVPKQSRGKQHCIQGGDSVLPSYYYQGWCPYTHRLLQLPRTPLIEEIARGLMAKLGRDEIYQREGKMYGILLVATPTGEQGVLKAFSGLLNGESIADGWVPSIAGRDRVAEIESVTLAELETIKQELIELATIPDRVEYQRLVKEFDLQLEELNQQHRDRKLTRDRAREADRTTLSGADLEIALAQLQQQSQRDGIERRNFKRDRDAKLKPLQEMVKQADERMRLLKQQRQTLSRQLQEQMHAAYNLMNFLGTSTSLRDLIPGGIPTGTGDCCAPKLLHYAATHHLQPLAMAEFWWGNSQGDRVQGEFYPACSDRCQPLMGFLLSGTNPPPIAKITTPDSSPPLLLLYQDDWLIAVNKPSGLLSVPGRYLDRQDSVLTRLRRLFPQDELFAVHRLDRDTSGILLFARVRDTYRHLSQQFEQRRVHKVYEAILGGWISVESGSIELPLWGDPHDRPRQQVNWELGKPSVTKFQVLARSSEFTQIEFIPLTGRTHQLRVHAADLQGLGVPILGDRLYGCQRPADRLHLHARELQFQHPRSRELIHLQTRSPF